MPELFVERVGTRDKRRPIGLLGGRPGAPLGAHCLGAGRTPLGEARTGTKIEISADGTMRLKGLDFPGVQNGTKIVPESLEYLAGGGDV